MATAFKEELDIVKGHVDTVMLTAWSRRPKGCGRGTLLEMTDNIWPLLLPSKAVDTIMYHTGAWKEIEKELSQVTSAARIGNELFGECCNQVLAEMVIAEIQAAIDTLFKSTTITSTVYENARRVALEDLKTVDLQGLPERRIIYLKYRGAEFAHRITC